ncbi:ion channel [Planomicrobium sp. CPCC 101079]|uniref:ion channel n=1 Tax=Planomicrobium sp. CPCC 101079 TaxID=2599618 RepID=UPI0011B6B834|nr:ion channel [Planomicrobium sp. CPCC 101079]TWT13468.1 ion transporter [Planomicrobium sp. CPCC 101079]
MIILKKLYFQATNLSWLILTACTVALIIFSTLLLPLIEPGTFTGYMDALWFTMTTMLTVGYGDLFPSTTGGRIFTVLFLYVIGIGLFASFIGKAVDSLTLYRRQKERGDLMFEGKNHIVIIDWSHKAENAMKEILERDEKVQIVVIDTIEKAKQINERIHFIRGRATDADVLRKANAQHAKAVLIFSDDKIEDQMLADGKSLMIACAVERISPGVHTTVEIEREEHILNFSHIKVDNFILSNATIAKLAVDSIL